jgi:hypothetical protein
MVLSVPQDVEELDALLAKLEQSKPTPVRSSKLSTL